MSHDQDQAQCGRTTQECKTMGWGLLDTGRASIKMNNIHVKMIYRKEHGE